VKAILGLLLPLGLVAAGAAGPAIVGSWDCVATDASGMQTSWTLRVAEASGKLSASIRSADGSITIDALEPKLDGTRFSFKVRINEAEVVELLLNLEGDRLEGRFAGKDSGNGVFKATRTPAADISGAWSGEWELGPDGDGGPHHMILKQDGEKVTGTAGPTPDMQLALENGKWSNGVLTFDIRVPSGPMLRFEFKPTGDTMPGTAVLIMNGTERKLKLTAKRLPR
jgi:hypothetical protein